MQYFFGLKFGKPEAQQPVVQQGYSGEAPLPGQKVFIEKFNDNTFEYSNMEPSDIAHRLHNMIHGFYGYQNMVNLFYCLPEVFAPIHEIASRVASATWQLRKDWNDEVDFGNADFNKLFTQPNPLQSHVALIYMSVAYEILTGGQFWHFNRISNDLLVTAPGDEYKNIAGWFNLEAQNVIAKQRKIDPYKAIQISDYVQQWEEVDYINGGKRIFQPDDVIPLLHLGMEKQFDLNCRKALILGAEKAIRNLIPVYEARGVIYIKRGALGFMVSKKSDESGMRSLTPGEKAQALKDFNGTYGVTGEKSPIGVTSVPLEFIRTAMSIAELLPFDETLADAAAIYGVLRVPPHLIPRKDHSTFANANEDLKAFYENVIIPWAERYAQIWTTAFAIPRRYIHADYSRVGVLQENKKTEADTANIMGQVWFLRWTSGACTLNDWIADIEGEPIVGDAVYEKKLFELTPDEIERVKTIINLKSKPVENGDNKKPPEGS